MVQVGVVVGGASSYDAVGVVMGGASSHGAGGCGGGRGWTAP